MGHVWSLRKAPLTPPAVPRVVRASLFPPVGKALQNCFSSVLSPEAASSIVVRKPMFAAEQRGRVGLKGRRSSGSNYRATAWQIDNGPSHIPHSQSQRQQPLSASKMGRGSVSEARSLSDPAITPDLLRNSRGMTQPNTTDLRASIQSHDQFFDCDEHAQAAKAGEDPNAVPVNHVKSDTSRPIDNRPASQSTSHPIPEEPHSVQSSNDANDRRFQELRRPTESSTSSSATSQDSNLDSSSTIVTSPTAGSSFSSPPKPDAPKSVAPSLSPYSSPTNITSAAKNTQSTPPVSKIKQQQSLPALSSTRAVSYQYSHRSPKTPAKGAKRQPASRSSYGIATANGPPQSLITRQSYSSDLGRLYRRHDREQAGGQPRNFDSLGHGSTTSRSAVTLEGSPVVKEEKLEERKSGEASSSKENDAAAHDGKTASEPQNTRDQNEREDMARGPRMDPHYEDDDHAIEDLIGLEEQESGRSFGAEGGNSAGSEDLFLHLAKKQDSVADDPGVTKRKSRIARVPQRQSFPTHYTPPARLRRDSNDQGSDYAESPLMSVTGESGSRYRRSSTFTTPSYRNHPESSPISPSLRIEPTKSRAMATLPHSPLVSPGSQPPNLEHGTRNRRPSISESMYAASARQRSYRPSRLNYDASADFNLDPESSTHDEMPLEEDTTITGLIGRPRAQSRAAMDATAESVGSNPTSAPSTVWDELDDIKSRIRNLELTGKWPSTSGATISSSPHTDRDRPRTAGTGVTTTVTTVSSSPRRATNTPKRSESLEGSFDPNTPTSLHLGGPAAVSLHPLLHDALTRAKELLPSPLYSSLEVAASDALELAVLASTSQSGPQGTASIYSHNVMGLNNFGSSNVDRKIKRKVDGLCRSMTELTIAMCDGRMDSNTTTAAAETRTRPGSKDGLSRRPSINGDHEGGPPVSYPLVNYSRVSRSASLEPDPDYIRSTPSRALDRIEARRSSLMTFQSNSATNSPRDSTNQPHSTFSPQSPAESKLHVPSSQPIRAGTSLLRNRHTSRPFDASSPITFSSDQAPDTTESAENSPSLRIPSRAATEVSPSTRHSLSERRHFNLTELRASRAKRLSLGREGPASASSSTTTGSGVYTSNVPLPETRSAYLTVGGQPGSSTTGTAKEGPGYAHGLRRVQMGLNVGTGERAASRIDTSRVPMSAGAGTRRYLDREGRRTSLGGNVAAGRNSSLRS
ncbi:hypothetical protein P152DRAFT_511125 [Eremomyces bilateralis CBS 781.70]|uniref:Uncharacterized protein n=1 Tax=Eremomyces bilateralis CBS 781.70 TaxID=1392243 RepID=A0A6G1GE73_9PEZI|nr:uncharacterized protein P152DRAFT_511125 [Eremomyces bilateralis CBS 781.70]KAF1816332.1 hypothetical protein P152DRAFT_511125 [Eremomyces bilateralis CBS 781.70]